MSQKYKHLTKQTARLSIKAFVLVALVGSIYGVVSYFGGDSQKARKEFEDKLSADTNTVNLLLSQLDKSGEAEKSYASIERERTSTSFVTNMDTLVAWMKDAKIRYRFGKPELTPANEVLSDKPELANFKESIALRPVMKLKFEAISDLHVFSFVDEVVRATPGFIRIDGLELTKKIELNDDGFAQMRKGFTPMAVDAVVTFSWIGISEKDLKKQNLEASAAQ